MSLIRDVYKLILSKAAKEDWPAICQVCKEFNELMATVKKAYFLKKVPHEIFLPAEFKFQAYRYEKLYLKPIFNYNVKIEEQRYRRRGFGDGISITFKFDFSNVRFVYGVCSTGIGWEKLHIKEHTTKFKKYDELDEYLMLEYNNKSYLIYNIDDQFLWRYFVPDAYQGLEIFPNITACVEKYPCSSPVIEILKKMFT